MAYSKIVLYQDLLATDLPDDPLLAEDLVLYFPEPLRIRFRPAIERHRLRREIIATYITNSMINRVRPTFVSQMTEETGKPASDVARAFTIIRDSFDLRSLWADIEALDNKLPARQQIEMFIEVGRLLERAVQWLLRSTYEKLEIAAYVAEFKPRIETLAGRLHEVLPAPLMASLNTRRSELEATGIPAALAQRVASLGVMAAALDIVRLTRAGRPVDEVARVYFGVGARFGLDRLRAAGASIAADTPWQKAAVAAMVDDLFNYQSILASRVISETNGARDPVDVWLASRTRVVDRIDQTMTDFRAASTVDLAMLTVASRQLRALVES
jgi:glutamate dehydrogenase